MAGNGSAALSRKTQVRKFSENSFAVAAEGRYFVVGKVGHDLPPKVVEMIGSTNGRDAIEISENMARGLGL